MLIQPCKSFIELIPPKGQYNGEIGVKYSLPHTQTRELTFVKSDAAWPMTVRGMRELTRALVASHLPSKSSGPRVRSKSKRCGDALIYFVTNVTST